nr:ribonuclease H-like domain-containing protein [Tanacetum cinerariifolium]
MQKYLLKQKFEGFSVSALEGLHKGYDRFQTLLSQLEIHGAGVSHEDANQKFLRSLPSSWSQVALIMRTKPGLDTLSFDDLYNNLIVFDCDVKGTTASSSSNTRNVAFVSADNTSSTNDVSNAYSVSSPSVSKSHKEGSSSYTDEVIHSFFANQSSAPQLDYNDLEQINDDDMEEIDLKWQVAMISMRIKKFHKRIGKKDCRAKTNQDSRRRDVGYNGNKARDNGRRHAYQDDSKALVTIDGEDIDWSGHVEEDAQNYAMMAYSSSNSGSDNETDAPIVEGYESDSDNDSVSNVQEDKEKPSFAFTDSVKHVKTFKENVKESGTTNHCPKVKKHGRNSHTRKGLGYAFTRKACFVCGSFSHLIRDCDFHEKRMAKQADLAKSKNKDDPHKTLKDKGIVDSGCSRHMTGNKAHLADYQEFKGGSVAFGGSNGRITGKGKIKAGSFNLKNIDPSGDLVCLFAKASIDESNKWHKRLGHVNFKNLNKLMKGNLVRGLPSKMFENDHTCVACKKGKQHKASCKAKTAEAVNTACYVLNRVLVTKPQNKTPYELLTGKFDGKSDSGFLLGYSLNSKAFRVYNLETKRVKENLYECVIQLESVLAPSQSALFPTSHFSPFIIPKDFYTNLVDIPG